MTDTTHQATVPDFMKGPLDDAEREAAQQLHVVVMGWAAARGNLTNEVAKTFQTMCENGKFSEAYRILTRVYGESEKISLQLMNQMAAWHTFTVRGFTPTAAEPNA